MGSAEAYHTRNSSVSEGRRDLRQSNTPPGEPREYQSKRGHSYFGRRN